MKIIYICLLPFFFLLFNCSCDSKDNNINLFPDSTNYEYIKIKDNLIKVIRFFPGTKDTSMIYFFNPDEDIKDSTFVHFDKNGNLYKMYKYEDKMRKRKYTDFYKNGNKKKEWTLIDNLINGNIYYYYENGTIKQIKEIIYINGKEYLNNLRVFNFDAELDRDKTYFVELIPEKDTINFNDSLLVELNVKIPKFTLGRAYTGIIDKNFNILDYNKIEFINGTKFYYKPPHTGKNYLRIIFEINTTPEKEYPVLYKTFLEKEIYVIN